MDTRFSASSSRIPSICQRNSLLRSTAVTDGIGARRRLSWSPVDFAVAVPDPDRLPLGKPGSTETHHKPTPNPKSAPYGYLLKDEARRTSRPMFSPPHSTLKFQVSTTHASKPHYTQPTEANRCGPAPPNPRLRAAFPIPPLRCRTWRAFGKVTGSGKATPLRGRDYRAKDPDIRGGGRGEGPDMLRRFETDSVHAPAILKPLSPPLDFGLGTRRVVRTPSTYTGVCVKFPRLTDQFLFPPSHSPRLGPPPR